MQPKRGLKNMRSKMLALLTVLLAVVLGACGTSYTVLDTITPAPGEGDGYGGTIEVDVTVDEYGITGVEVVSNNEDPKVAGAALESLPKAIMAAQSADVDAVSGATMTSDAIVSAVMNALGLAMVQ
jgi:fumarate reductase flavoprotein subunit